MLSFRSCNEIPALGASIEAIHLLHPCARVYVVRTRGVVVDKRLAGGAFRPARPGPRSLAQIVVSGRMRLARGVDDERWLGPGEISLQEESIRDERWEGDPFEVLVVEWYEGLFGDRARGWSTGRLDDRDRARVAELARRLGDAGADPRAGAAVSAQICAVLAAAGLPLGRPEIAAIGEPPAAMLAIARVLGRAMSELGDQPMLADLERIDGRCDRQIRRGIDAFMQRYRFVPGWGFRDLLSYWRLHVATALMSAPGARTEAVARAVGYRSPNAFCVAMNRAGLPAPGAIRRRVQALQ